MDLSFNSVLLPSHHNPSCLLKKHNTPDLQRCLLVSAVLWWTGCLHFLLPGRFLQAAHRAHRCLGRPHVPSTCGNHITLGWLQEHRGGHVHPGRSTITYWFQSYQSIACSIPWFPVLATAFSLKTCDTGHTESYCFTFTSVKAVSNLGTPCGSFMDFTHALFLSKPISSRLSSVVCSAILTWNTLCNYQNYIRSSYISLTLISTYRYTTVARRFIQVKSG